MPILESLLASISENGRLLVNELGPSTAQVSNEGNQNPFDGSPRLQDKDWLHAQKLVSDCYELISLLMPRQIKLLQDSFAVATTSALGIASHFKIADLIEEVGGRATIPELAAAAGTDETKLASVMRTLTATHIFVERENGVFSNNRHSNELRTDLAPGSKEMIELYSLILGKPALNGLLPVMEDPKRMHTIDPKCGAFAVAYDRPVDSIEWCLLPENHEYLTKIMAGMPWLTNVVTTEIVQNFDWSKWGSNLRICDMGCADGGVMAKVKQKCPQMHIICQDLENVVGGTKKTFQETVPDALEKGEIEVLVHDYFTPQDVQADIYWLRGVLQLYSDEDSLKILRLLKPCLELNVKTRILVNELVVPRIIIPQSANDEPGSKRMSSAESSFPHMVSLMQLHTTAFLGGLERTFEDWQQLFSKAGLRIIEFHQIRMFTAIFELGLEELSSH